MKKYILSNFENIDESKLRIISRRPGLLLIEATKNEIETLKNKYLDCRIIEQKLSKLC